VTRLLTFIWFQRRAHVVDGKVDERADTQRQPALRGIDDVSRQLSGETLNFSLHRSTSQQYEHYDYTNDPFIPPSATFYNNLSFHEDDGTTEFGADYALPVSKTRSLKLGYAFEQDDYRFGNVGNNIDPASGVQEIDPSLTNQFKFRQVIHLGRILYVGVVYSFGSTDKQPAFEYDP